MHLPDTWSIHRFLIFAAGLAATAASAPAVLAADLPLKGPSAPGPAVSWAGLYAGVHGGWGWRDTRIPVPFASPPFGTAEAFTDGPLAGAQVGANWQSGNIVYGVELDASWTYMRANTSLNQSIPSSSSRDKIDFRAMATATGRVGYAMNSWLFYAKGGAAWANVEITSPNLAVPPTWDRNEFGVAAGVGLEVAFLRNVSAKVEYNFLYFLPDHIDGYWPPAYPAASIDHFVQVVKAGINVHLGGGLER